MNISVYSATVGTSSSAVQLPPRSVALMLEALATNTADVNINLNGSRATIGDAALRPGDLVVYDITEVLKLKETLQGLSENDFLRFVNMISTAAQTVNVWVLAL